MTMIPTLEGPERGPAQGDRPRALVVLLHGLGADGEDLIELAGHWAQALPECHFIAPNGPEPCDMAPMGYQWFSLQDRSPAALAAGAARARATVDRFIDAQCARLDLSLERVALVGFSQGTMTALHLAPRRPAALAGVVGYSGALLAPETLAAETLSRPPVLLIHGDADPVVPPEALTAAADALGQAGFAAEWHLCHGLGHGIDAEGLRRGGEFLTRVLGA